MKKIGWFVILAASEASATSITHHVNWDLMHEEALNDIKDWETHVSDRQKTVD